MGTSPSTLFGTSHVGDDFGDAGIEVEDVQSLHPSRGYRLRAKGRSIAGMDPK